MCTEDDTEANATAPAAPGSAWQAAVAAGLDMSLVEQSLAKTPWERLQDHDDALAFAEMLRAANPSGHAPA